MAELSKEQKDNIVKILNERKRTQVVTLGGYAGTGKCSANSALVYTPFGPKKMGDLKIGDQVSNPDGSVAKIIAVYPQGIRPVFKVSFVDYLFPSK